MRETFAIKNSKHIPKNKIKSSIVNVQHENGFELQLGEEFKMCQCTPIMLAFLQKNDWMGGHL